MSSFYQTRIIDLTNVERKRLCDMIEKTIHANTPMKNVIMQYIECITKLICDNRTAFDVLFYFICNVYGFRRIIIERRIDDKLSEELLEKARKGDIET